MKWGGGQATNPVVIIARQCALFVFFPYSFPKQKVIDICILISVARYRK